MPSDVLNLAMRDRDDLEEANYVRKADPNSDYRIDFSKGKWLSILPITGTILAW